MKLLELCFRWLAMGNHQAAISPSLASAVETPKRIVAQQADGHPDVVLRTCPGGDVAIKVCNGTPLQEVLSQGDSVQVKVLGSSSTGWAKKRNIQPALKHLFTPAALPWWKSCHLCRSSVVTGTVRKNVMETSSVFSFSIPFAF